MHEKLQAWNKKLNTTMKKENHDDVNVRCVSAALKWGKEANLEN